MQNDKQKIKALGNYLMEKRKSKNLSLSAVAFRCGIEPSTVYRIENGITEAKYTTLAHIIKCLEIEPQEIFNLK